MDCLRPPLREVPEGDWYCEACEPIVQAQYDSDVIVVSSADDDKEVITEDDKDYRPHRQTQAAFELELSSSEVDITGSDFNDSDSSCAMSMKLDSEPTSELESESDSSSIADDSSRTSDTSSDKNSIVDIIEDSKPKCKKLTSDPLLPSNPSFFSTDPLSSRIKKTLFQSSSELLSGATQGSPWSRLDPLLQTRHGLVQRLQNVGVEREAEEYIEIESSDDSEVVSKVRSGARSNRDISSPSTSDASCINVDSHGRKKRRAMFIEESESEDNEIESADGKGKSPVSSSRKRARRKALTSPSQQNDGHVSGQSLPDSAATSLHPTSKRLHEAAKTWSATASDSSPLRLPNGLKWPDDEADDDNDVDMPGRLLREVVSSAGAMGQQRQRNLPRQQHQRNRPLSQQQQQQQQRKRKRRPRKRRNLQTAKKTASKRGTKKRRRRTKLQLLKESHSLFIDAGPQSARLRARTAATHTPRRNAMREAVRESYRYDNKLEGLESAREILARSVVVPLTTPRRSKSFQTPTSGYVVKTGRNLKNTDEHDSESTPAIERLYGFTPCRRQRGLRPSVVSSGGATPPPKKKNSHMTAKDRRISAEVQRRQAQRRRRNPQVVVTPVKLRGLKLEPSPTAIKMENFPSSSSRKNGGTTDILGEMCRGLKVLQNKEHTIGRDGSIIPKGIKIVYRDGL